MTQTNTMGALPGELDRRTRPPRRPRAAHRSGGLGVLIVVVASAWAVAAAGDDWPQWRGPNRDGVWSETGVVDRFDSPEIEVKWRVPISSGYSGPTVAKGRVYVTDRVARPEEIERVLFLLAYSADPRLWDQRSADFGEHDDLVPRRPEQIAPPVIGNGELQWRGAAVQGNPVQPRPGVRNGMKREPPTVG